MLLSLNIFSITTIELSTSIPIARASPASDITLILIPVKYIIIIANNTLKGILNATIIVGRTLFKNNANTIIASKAPISILYNTLSRNIEIYVDWSVTGTIFTPGYFSSRYFIASRQLADTSLVLAVLALNIARSTVSSPLYFAYVSAASFTIVTSDTSLSLILPIPLTLHKTIF